jgi:hypothetical protein
LISKGAIADEKYGALSNDSFIFRRLVSLREIQMSQVQGRKEVLGFIERSPKTEYVQALRQSIIELLSSIGAYENGKYYGYSQESV